MSNQSSAETQNFPRTDADDEAERKSAQSTGWAATSRIKKGLGEAALEGQGLPGMGPEVATIPIDDESGPAQIIDVQLS